MRVVSLSILFLCIHVIALAQSKTDAKRNGISYFEIYEADSTDKRVAKFDELLELDYRMAVGSNDSILTETFTKGMHINIPVSHPSFAPVFKSVKKGDKIMLMMSADSFYKYTMMQPSLPWYIKPGDSLFFYFKVYDVMSELDYATKEYNKDLNALREDSIEFQHIVSNYNRVKKTANGVYYVVSKYGEGKQVKDTSTIIVSYRAYLHDGKVFEKSKPGGIRVRLGKGELISGWEDALPLMKEGALYKLIIPQSMAYGPRGSDNVPPYSTVIFDVEVIKVE